MTASQLTPVPNAGEAPEDKRSPQFSHSLISGLVRNSRATQGLPTQISDSAVIARLATLLRSHNSGVHGA